ncbi:MAG TPA: PepSY domain-containing protein [Actinophytocola sp.]|nr:PepSY domain-containing protein [Actinophytocola sp.]
MDRRTIVVAAAAGVLVVSAGTAVALATNDSTPSAVQPLPTASSTSTSTPTSSTPTSSTPDTSTSDTSTSTSSDTPTAQGDPRLTPDAAAQLVRHRLGGGQVREIERETEHGRLEWKVEITKDGVTHDVRVDAETGDITRVDTDDDRDDDRDRDDRDDDDRDRDEDGDR